MSIADASDPLDATDLATLVFLGLPTFTSFGLICALTFPPSYFFYFPFFFAGALFIGLSLSEPES